MTLPPPVAAPDDIAFLRSRLTQHTRDTYAGIPISKFPEDLRVYEHLLWHGRVDCVVEIGTEHGGSAVWFRDRLRANRAHGLIGRVRVISVDIDQSRARANLAEIGLANSDEVVLLERDVTEPGLAEAVSAHIPAGASCMLVEDGGHTHDTTLAGIAALASVLGDGGFLVVEDAVVDDDALRVIDTWPRGVASAIDAFLSDPAGAEFRRRDDLALYGVTCHPRGFLQRVGQSPARAWLDVQGELSRPPDWMYPWPLPDGNETPVAMDELPLIHATRQRAIAAGVSAHLEATGPNARGIDLACSEGWFSQRLLEWGARSVVGVDIRASNVYRARLMRDLAGIGADRLEFRHGDIYNMLPTALGRFDVVLLLGLVYHVEDPVGLLRRARRLTSDGGICVVESQLTRHREPTVHGWGRSGTFDRAQGSWALRIELDSEINPVASFGGIASFIPNAVALEESVLAAGFAGVEWLPAHPGDSQQYIDGDRGMLIARTQ